MYIHIQYMYKHVYTVNHPALYLLSTVLSDPSLWQYVFVPVATEYSPQTDHVSNTTVIHGYQPVCLYLWHCCRLILLPPARLYPPSGPSSLSSVSTFSNPSSVTHTLRLDVSRLAIPFPPWSFLFLDSLCLLSQFFSPLSPQSLPVCVCVLFLLVTLFILLHQTWSALTLNIVLIGFPLCSLTLL